MPLFRKRSRSVSNTTAVLDPPSPPQETVIHNYAPSKAWEILVGFGVGVAGLVLLWQALVFLAGEAGYPNPSRAVVTGLMILAIISAALVLANALVRYVLSGWWAHQERMEQMHLQSLEKRMRLAQSISPGVAPDMKEEDKRKYRAVVMAMSHAFSTSDELGKLRTRSEPWSKRSVGKFILLGETKEIGEDSDLAKWVKPFLLDKRIILDDKTINLVQFPDLAAVEALLIAEFGRGIMMTAPGQNGGMSTHHVIRGASGQGSWG